MPLRGKPKQNDDNVCQLRRMYYVNGSDGDVRKIISTLQGKLLTGDVGLHVTSQKNIIQN